MLTTSLSDASLRSPHLSLLQQSQLSPMVRVAIVLGLVTSFLLIFLMAARLTKADGIESNVQEQMLSL